MCTLSVCPVCTFCIFVIRWKSKYFTLANATDSGRCQTSRNLNCEIRLTQRRNTKACIKTAEGAEVIVELINLSRGGVCFTNFDELQLGTPVSIAPTIWKAVSTFIRMVGSFG